MTDSEVLAKIRERWDRELTLSIADVTWLLHMAERAIPPWDGVEPTPAIMDALRRAER